MCRDHELQPSDLGFAPGPWAGGGYRQQLSTWTAMSASEDPKNACRSEVISGKRVSDPTQGGRQAGSCDLSGCRPKL